MTGTDTGAVTVRIAAIADLDRVTGLLAAAYQGGDLAPWLVPGPVERYRIYPGYFRILAEHALARGKVDLIDGVAVAAWYALGENPRIDIADYDRRLAKAVGPRHLARFNALDSAMRFHHPAGQPHDYLAFLAVHPNRQGHGYGSLLLRRHLKGLDTTGTPSYLVATGTRNQTLFRRYSYKSRPPFSFDGDESPLVYPMLRAAYPAPP